MHQIQLDEIRNPRLSGYGGNDTLYGTDNSDILDGGTGVDTMIGGGGGDLYIVDNVLDVIVGAFGDSVESSVSYTLSNKIRQLKLVGTADLSATGNAEEATVATTSLTARVAPIR